MNPQEAIRSFLGQYWGIIAVVIALLCVLWFLVYFFGLMGKTGLIKGAHKADTGVDRLSFGELWNESLPYFWRMFGLTLLIGLPFFIIIMIVLVVFLANVFGIVANGVTGGAALAKIFVAMGIFIPAMCCLSIVLGIVGMIVEQARNAMVIEDTGVLESLRRGWAVFKRNFLAIFLISVLLWVLALIIGFIIAIPMLLALAPVAMALIPLLMSPTAVTGSAFLAELISKALIPLAITGVCVLVYLPVLLVVRGIEETYIQSALTLTYLRLTTPTTPVAPPVPPEPINAQ